MNILLTNICNGKCVYCFAYESMFSNSGKIKPKEISLDNLKTLLDFLQKNKETETIRLLGGEPSLHSKLEEVFDNIINKGFKQIEFFSNGIIAPYAGEILKKYQKYLVFVWNINPPGLYSPKIQTLIERNIHELKGKSNFIGLNIYKTDYNPSFIMKIIKKNPHIDSVRIGIAHPIGNKLNPNNQNYVKIADYPTIGKIIYKFIVNVSKQFPHIKKVKLDCGYTPCLFNSKQLKHLKRLNILDPFVSCSPSLIDVNTDLNIESCFVTTGTNPSHSLSRFKSIGHMKYMFARQWIFSRKHLPYPDKKCAICIDRYRCFAGCGGERILLARKMQANWLQTLKNNIKPEKRIELLYDLALSYSASNNLINAKIYISKAEHELKNIVKTKSTKYRYLINYLKKQLESIFESGLHYNKLQLTDYGTKAMKNFNEDKISYFRSYDPEQLNIYASQLLNLCITPPIPEQTLFKNKLQYNKWKKSEMENFIDTLWNIKYDIKDLNIILIYSKALKYIYGEKEYKTYLSKILEKYPKLFA